MRNFKTYFIFSLLILFAFVIAWRLFCLQIKQGDYYEALALGQQVSFEESGGKRGDIFLSQTGLALAAEQERYLIYIFQQKVSAIELEKEMEILSDVLNQDKEFLLAEVRKSEVVRKKITKSQAEAIEKAGLKAVFVDVFLTRFYPQENLASHLLGFVNQEGQGQYGIEGYYNEVLQGKKSIQTEERSSFAYLSWLSNKSNEVVSQSGDSLFLTIDENIQYLAEKLLTQAAEKWQIEAGQIIAQDPLSGKILALASWPNFNPNQYGEEQSLEVFLNPATQNLFEPGSVFKPITMAGALEEELITPQTEYEDKGFVEAGGPPIYNFEKRVWGKQTMTDVLEESINTGAVFVQRELGKDLFLQYLDKFGFFEKTEIDLQGETFSVNDALKRGYERDLATASFGQGIEITALQLVRAFSAIANGGKLFRPYVVEEITEPNGRTMSIKPHLQREVISEKTAAKLTSMLIHVIEQGSGRGAKIPGYYIAGKTGTAQVVSEQGGYSENKTVQSFIGYFPALKPQILILIKLDNPQGIKTAEYSAGPLFRELAKYIIDLKEIPPDYE